MIEKVPFDGRQHGILTGWGVDIDPNALRRTVKPAQKSYPGSASNGVTTSDYADFPHCWALSAI